MVKPFGSSVVVGQVLNPNPLSKSKLLGYLGGMGVTAVPLSGNSTTIVPAATTDPGATVITAGSNGSTTTTTTTGGVTGTGVTTSTAAATTVATPIYKQCWFWAGAAIILGIASYFYFTKIKK